MTTRRKPDANRHADTSDRQYRKARDRYRAKCEQFNVPCHLCGQPIIWGPDSPDPFTLDHFYPRSTHPELALDPGNFRPSHASCNKSRGAKDVRPLLGNPSEAW
ncbi:HNH endonuclease [Gordonia polyisoprenivorans]|uniref:HNH endonuclease n=1 Tax=Gordonia polyisoprenivorans TaxID=84595 RepID=UPI0005BE81A0|nr:HNH endonuclease [Gordonia polyisoprenivorans]